MARPRLEIDPGSVEALAADFCTTAEIAATLGCSSDTLERRYAASLRNGRARARAALRRLQWEAARDGSVMMMIWLGKQWLGQTDRREVRTTVTGGPTIFRLPEIRRDESEARATATGGA